MIPTKAPPENDENEKPTPIKGRTKAGSGAPFGSWFLFFRYASFSLFHLVDLSTNLAVMCILAQYMSSDIPYAQEVTVLFALLLSAWFISGSLCALKVSQQTHTRKQ